jgi:hypothetical protein
MLCLVQYFNVYSMVTLDSKRTVIPTVQRPHAYLVRLGAGVSY